MPVTKESEKVLKKRILGINEELQELRSLLDPLKEKKLAYEKQIEALQSRIDKINEEKTNINKDMDKKDK